MFDRHITYHALTRPHAVAVVTPHGEIRYGHLDDSINRMVAALVAVGLPQDGLVAIRVRDPLAHWIIILALARLGKPTASFGAMQSDQIISVLKPDLVITDLTEADIRPLTKAPVFTVEAKWLEAVLDTPAPPAPRAILDPQSLGRVSTSSGTTGTPKKLGLSWDLIGRRVVQSATQAGASLGLSRAMSILGIEAGGFNIGLATWASGGALVIGSPDPKELARQLPELKPSTLLASPIQLRMLLDALPAGFMPLASMSVALTGSHTPLAVQRAIRLRLTPDLWIAYGSTEAGPVAQIHAAQVEDNPAAAGWIVPFADVQIVDDKDKILAFGELGRVRVRTRSGLSGYLDDAAATKAFFKSGWFYPGDLGSLSRDGKFLSIEGRTDDVINLGGEKILPRMIEDAVLGCVGVMDAGAFSVPDPVTGLPIVWLAAVKGPGFDEEALSKALQLPGVPKVNVAWIDSIPRNALGKIQRDQLRVLALGAPSRKKFRPTISDVG